MARGNCLMLRRSKPVCIASLGNLSPICCYSASRMKSEVNDLLMKDMLTTPDDLNEALSLFCAHKLPQSCQTYAALFHGCGRHRSLQQGCVLHEYMLANNPTYSTDLFVTNHLINMYCKCGNVDYAYQLFNEMPKRNLVSWTALITGFSQQGAADKCFHLFRSLLVHNRPNEFTLTSLLVAFNKNHGNSGRQVHGLALKMSLDACVYVANALIAMYTKTSGSGGFLEESKDEAWTVFKSIKYPNLISWNSIIAAFCFRKLGNQALNIFFHMHREGIGFDRATLLSTLSSSYFCKWGELSLGLGVCHGLHCLTLKTGFFRETEVATALVKAYSDLGGEVAECHRLFLEAGCHRDIVSWTAIITAFAECDPEKALFLFHQLLEEDLSPDCYTFSIVLKACASLLTERHASAYHSQLVKLGLENDIVVSNSLIHAYARCGSVALSKQIFDEMRFHDLASWNSMIKAYAVHGQAEKALQLFSLMNVVPDSVTYVALLSACSHAGLVEEGSKLFDLMFEKRGIVPQLDHYACMVDILGRAGRVFEAYELITRLPIEPDAVVWSSLLGSCRKHGWTQLAKLAADKMKELDPENSLGYVQMSNICCSSGRFDEAVLIRKEMGRSRVRKEPGLSWIEIGNKVHEFASGGRRLLEKEVICSKLEVLIGKLKEMGYVAETSSTMQDIEEEQKEEQLYHHSEKLALVFAIMNEGSLHCGGNVIRIMKNIRICVDCHNFMKLASDLLKKEIVVRDSNRFHHFKAGLCSCKENW